ncbi:MAG: glycerophosphodiester phosphodiesterase [Lachnospiraceae bacterium]|nr:glycerophosphodiester phosphodiesterase [Lachnospiraceae bacterium]
MRTAIIAHRGASKLAGTDNTIESFSLAISLGADYVEMDVRQTKDKKLIVFHDDVIDNTPIKFLTYDELNKKVSEKNYSVPLFEDVLKLCQGKIKLDIELKETGYEFKVLSLVKKYFSYDGFMIKSFLDTAVKKVELLDKKVNTGLLLGYKKADVKRRVNEFLPKRRLKLLDVDFVSPHYKLVTWDYMLRMRLMKKKVYVWTVNDQTIMKKLLKKNVDGIITDSPDLAISIRDEYYNRKGH